MNSKILTIAISSRALFSIEDGNAIYEKQGQDAFDNYMMERRDRPLKPGVAFPLISKLLALNTKMPPAFPDRVRVVVLSRNSPAAGERIANSIHHYGLPIEAAVFCSGADRFALANAFGVDLFLSANAGDVKLAIDRGLAAATLLPREHAEFCSLSSSSEVVLGFDGDSVIFDNESDLVYQQHGLDSFRSHEVDNAQVPLNAGPYKSVLMKLVEIQKSLKGTNHPVALKIALITARGMPAHTRVMTTLRHWGATIDTAVFAAGAKKGPILNALGVDFFVDDAPKNISSAEECDIVAGHVPFGTGEGIVGADSK